MAKSRVCSLRGLLLLDEVVAVFVLLEMDSVMATLRNLLATTNLTLIVAVLESGHAALSGTVDELVGNDEVRRTYLGI
ncbi:hypothetical protein [Acidovorax sp.]|uniref:hypothetical protein n=1 Tax=Acidovorax sp. TaxID=1872122 RepID=UPI0026025364|nr:hypothetical protein [Acidovorax sp.]